MARFFQGLFGGTKATSPPATALRLNSAVQGQPIPLLLAGAQRMGGTIIDYYGFNSVQASSSSSGGGKGGITGAGGKGQSGSYLYYVTFLLAFCDGPVAEPSGLGSAFWFNGSPNFQPGTPFYGDYSQGPWGYTESQDPGHALAYRGITYFAWPSFALGSSPSLPNITATIITTSTGFVPGQLDGDPTFALTQFLTNEFWGVGFPSARLGALSGTPSSWQAYCKSLGFGVSPAIASSIQASSWLNDLVTATNSAACWQDGLLTVAPYGDTGVQQGQVTAITETHSVPAFVGPFYPQITVGNSGNFVADQGVMFHGGAPFTKVPFPPLFTGTYSVTPGNGIYTFNPADSGASVDISYTFAAAASYVPDVIPIYDFTIDDFLPNQGTIGSGLSAHNSPIVIVRKPRDQMLNNIKVEYLDRSNSYNPVDIEFKDSASIVAFGRERPSDVKQYHFFCLASAATTSAALQLVRAQVPRQYQWTVGKHFILILSLMKAATLTMPQLGLARQLVRIIEIQENADQSLTITAEDLPGTAAAPTYGTQASTGYQQNDNQDPGLINIPLIFEPSDELGRALISGGGLMIAGAISGVTPSMWGGCQVWASYDGANYQNIGTVTGNARMGVLTASLPSVTASATGQTIDTVNTLSVDLTESNGALASGSQLDATSLNTRCFIGPLNGQPNDGTGEVIAFETATLTATSKYNLTYLVRGAYGTEAEIATWPIGTGFARLDQGIFTVPYDQSRIGSTIYLKFVSFNIWQGGAQSLADVPAYTYVITGAALASPLPDIENLTAKIVDGRLNISWDEIDDFRNGIRYEIRQGDTFDGALSLGTVAHPPFAVPGNGTYWVTGWVQPASGLIVRSETPVSIVVAGATIVANVVATFDCQAAGWPGTFGGGAGIDSGLNAVRTGGAGNILTDLAVVESLITTAATASGAVLTFAGGVPSTIVAGLAVVDQTAGSAITTGTQVLSTTSTTVTLTAAVAGAGVGSGDTIVFSTADVLSYGGEQNGTYTPAFIVDVGRVAPVTITISLKGTGVPVGQNILASTNILTAPDILGSASAAFVDVFANLLIAQAGPGSILTDTNVLTDPNVLAYGIPFAAPQKYSPGDYVGRVFAFPFDLNTVDPNTIAYLLEAVISVQMPARIDTPIVNGVLPAIGQAITFTPNGSATPAGFNGGVDGNNGSLPSVTVTWSGLDKQPGDIERVTNLSETGCTVQILNGGVGVQRSQVNVFVEGF